MFMKDMHFHVQYHSQKTRHLIYLYKFCLISVFIHIFQKKRMNCLKMRIRYISIQPKLIPLKKLPSMTIAILWLKVLVTFLRVNNWATFTNQCNTKVFSNVNIKTELCWKNSLVFEIKQAKYAKGYLERQIFHHYWKANDKMHSNSISYENVEIC